MDSWGNKHPLISLSIPCPYLLLAFDHNQSIEENGDVVHRYQPAGHLGKGGRWIWRGRQRPFGMHLIPQHVPHPSKKVGMELAWRPGAPCRLPSLLSLQFPHLLKETSDMFPCLPSCLSTRGEVGTGRRVQGMDKTVVWYQSWFLLGDLKKLSLFSLKIYYEIEFEHKYSNEFLK